MDARHTDALTLLLARAGDGDEEALDQVLPLVYDILRRMSRRELRRVGGPATLSTTELVHEAYLKLAPGTRVRWRDRHHFFGVAARAMRQVLVDRARRRTTRHQGTDRAAVALGPHRLRFDLSWDELLSLDTALERLATLSPRMHEVVELRFFAGLPEEEIAEALEVSPRTVRRDWQKARLFLHRELHPDGATP